MGLQAAPREVSSFEGASEYFWGMLVQRLQ